MEASMCGIVGYIGKIRQHPSSLMDSPNWNTADMIRRGWPFLTAAKSTSPNLWED